MSFDKMRRYITNQFVFLRNEMHFLEFKRCIFHLHLIITSLIYLFNIYMHDLEIAIRLLFILAIWNTVIILVPKIISNIHPVMGIINLYHCHYKKYSCSIYFLHLYQTPDHFAYILSISTGSDYKTLLS